MARVGLGPGIAVALALAAPAAMADDFSIVGRNGTEYYGWLPHFPARLSADGRVIAGTGQLDPSETASQVFIWQDGVYTPIGSLDPGQPGTVYLGGISADGAVLTGTSTVNYVNRAFRWTADDGMIDIGTLGGDSAEGIALSGDGSTIVGGSMTLDNQLRAFRWRDGAMQQLGTLGSESSAQAVSGDGMAAAGLMRPTEIGPDRVFYWSETTGMVAIGSFGGEGYDSFGGLSADGRYVIGGSELPGWVNDPDSAMNGSSFQHAFRWDVTNGMIDLGTIGGHWSSATLVSADGSVVAGRGTTANDYFDHAFRWTEATGIVDLGTLGGNEAWAMAMTASGNAIVGWSTRDEQGLSSMSAFRWTEDTGMLAIADLLAASGIDVGSWKLTQARQISADGSVIFGIGTDMASGGNGTSGMWMTRCATLCAIIDTSDYGNSVAGLGGMGHTSNALTDTTLRTMSDLAAEADGGVTGFVFGAYDTDPTASATAGFTAELAPDLVIGASLSAANVVTDMPLGGISNLNGGTLGAFFAATPETGLQWLLGVSTSALAGTVERAYHNGNAIVTSQGETAGRSYGATARLGFAAELADGIDVTPYAAYTIANVDYDGWTETGGPFPAVIAPFAATAQTVRAGFDTRLELGAADLTLGLAYARRVDGGGNGTIEASLPGITDFTVPGANSASEWVEVSGAVELPVSEATSLTTAVTTLLPSGGSVSYQSRAGLSFAF